VLTNDTPLKTMQEQSKLIETYFKKIKAANKELTKKEVFKDLLNRLYAGNNEIKNVIDAISAGAERTILNIPRANKLRRGSADTLFNNIIIEFENNLKQNLTHAKEQLAGYLLGQFNSGEGYNFTLIASDFIHWKVFSPDASQLGNLHTLNEEELILHEVKTASFTLTETNAEDFFYWLDRYLFKETKQKATLERIEESFGYQSPVFIESLRRLSQHFAIIKKSGEVNVSFEQWEKFLSIAYGSFDASEQNFLIHTYLSVFAKMLAYAVVSNDDYIDDSEMKEIINGSIFRTYHIENFVENDFFHWVGNENSFRPLKQVFRVIAQEISTFDFNNVDEDILKGVYQELIDLDTRHALGEYYTPDWLCERVVQEFDFKPSEKILDPACGSGSFLRAAIHRIKELNPTISAEQIIDNIHGIDIHPLSVQIAKTTILIALSKEIQRAKKPVHINVLLANTILAPEGVSGQLFGDNFELEIDTHKLYLNTQILHDDHFFDQAIEICEDLAEQTMNGELISERTFVNNVAKRTNTQPKPAIVSDFYAVYHAMKKVKENGRNSIWKFVILNSYKPYFLGNRFEYVIGNPPWFTYSSIKNIEYQKKLDRLAVKYSIQPEKKANYPHLEIAAIFLAHCSSYFLKAGGKIAFVVPRSFFSGDQHDNTRSGRARGFRLTQIWDLKNVAPLFRIPSGVLFGEKQIIGQALPKRGVAGISFAGALPQHNCNLVVAQQKINETEETWYYVKQGASSAFSTQKRKTQNKVNPYREQFKNGATLYPRSFQFIELPQGIPADWDDRVLLVKTSDTLEKDAKAPWKGLVLQGHIESEFVFRTALAKSILPFALHKPNLVVLPISIEISKQGRKKIKLHSADNLLKMGYSYASRWFDNAEKTWDKKKTSKNKNQAFTDNIDWQQKLTNQNLDAPYLVLYNSSAKDANATVVSRADLDLEFIVENKSYVYYCKKVSEAYYLTAILNSTTPNLLMKDFQSTGLFGARDVHRKILDIYFPPFDAGNAMHRRLADLSRRAHEKVSTYLTGLDPAEDIQGMALGRIRLFIKNTLLHKELAMIDRIVREIIG
jgi:type I restriction-modification system DNA methylase subunit